MKTNIIRLEANADAINIPAGARVPVMPPVVAINTSGIPIEQQITPDGFVAPRPGLYRFSSVACGATQVIGVYLQQGDRQYVCISTEVPGVADRTYVLFPPTTLLLKAGDTVRRDVFNGGAADAALWPFAESNSFEIEYLGEAA